MERILKAILILSSLTVAACTQEPASIVYKGHIYYTANNMKESPILAKINKTEKPSFITRIIKGKKEQKEAPVAPASGNYIIAKGDTLYSIAKANKISTRQLIEENNLEPPYILYPGSKLNIPKERKTHIVAKGENVSKIARDYGVSMNDIISINNLKAPYSINTGNVLIIPYQEDTQKNLAIIKQKQKQIIKPNRGSSYVQKAQAIIKKEQFIWPVKGTIITQFGPTKNGLHNDGINIKAERGAEIRSTSDGKVVYVGNQLRGYGNLIIIKHSGGWLSAYAHNDEIYVTKGQDVKRNEIIATVGSSGSVDTPQLHFGLRRGRKPVNPISYLKS